MAWRSETSEGPTHLDLLALARAMRGAVIDDDTDAVHALLCRLRTDLAQHLRDEQEILPSALGPVLAVVADGHRRLLALLDDVLLDVDRDVGLCNCLLRAAEIEIMLRRQALLEVAALNHRSGPARSGPARSGP